MKNISSKMKIKSSHSGAFTLIEMLVVIAIIALLTGIVLTSLTGSKSKARDVKRISDIGNIQVALALFFDRCKGYPDVSTLTTSTTIDNCPTITTVTPNRKIQLGDFISVIPVAPSNGEVYSYGFDSNTPPQDYILGTKLENYNEVLKDDIDAPTYSVTCTDSSPNFYYCLGPK